MRIEPAEAAVNKKELDEEKQIRIQKITRKVALVVAFISVFFFIVKILFL